MQNKFQKLKGLQAAQVVAELVTKKEGTFNNVTIENNDTEHDILYIICEKGNPLSLCYSDIISFGKKSTDDIVVKITHEYSISPSEVKEQYPNTNPARMILDAIAIAEDKHNALSEWDFNSEVVDTSKIEYFIFGEDACQLLIEGGIEELISDIKNPLSEMSFALYEFDFSSPTPADMLNEFSGWGDYQTLTKEDYLTLKILQ